MQKILDITIKGLTEELKDVIGHQLKKVLDCTFILHDERTTVKELPLMIREEFAWKMWCSKELAYDIVTINWEDFNLPENMSFVACAKFEAIKLSQILKKEWFR